MLTKIILLFTLLSLLYIIKAAPKESEAKTSGHHWLHKSQTANTTQPTSPSCVPGRYEQGNPESFSFHTYTHSTQSLCKQEELRKAKLFISSQHTLWLDIPWSERWTKINKWCLFPTQHTQVLSNKLMWNSPLVRYLSLKLI